jgi:hypothetical protein
VGKFEELLNEPTDDSPRLRRTLTRPTVFEPKDA